MLISQGSAFQHEMSNSTESIVRTGIIGTGDLGTTLAGQIQSHTAGAVTALADVNPEALEHAGNQFDVDPAYRYDDYQDLLASAPIDAVVIATPHAFHYEQTVAALESEFDVLCEKPLTVDLEEGRALVERDETSDQILMVGYQRHLFPPFIEAKEQLHGSNGKPSYINAETTQEWISLFREKWRSNPDLSGGGQLYDTGSHLIDAVLWVADVYPERVYAEMIFEDDDQRVDKHASLSLRFQNGGVGSITVSGDTRQRFEHLHFANENGGVLIENQMRLFEFNDAGEQSEVQVDFSSRTKKGVAFIDSVLERSEPPSTAQHSLAVTAVTEAAYESAKKNEPIDIEPIP